MLNIELRFDAKADYNKCLKEERCGMLMLKIVASFYNVIFP